MDLFELIKSHKNPAGGDVDPVPVVLSSRIRLARNLQDFPFPGWAKVAERRKLLGVCEDVVKKVPQLKKPVCIDVHKLNALEKQVLVERHLISRELSSSQEGSGVIISKDQTCSIMVNEEDHLRIQMMKGGFNLKALWKSIDKLDTSIEEHLDYAFSGELGYLTACPTNVGTGLRGSVMMHLPALVVTGQMEKVIRAVNQLGIAVRGIFGEGSDASGSIFQISNQQTLGESETDILDRLTSVLQTIVEQEINARGKLLESESNKIHDKIGRAHGILQNSYLATSAEAMNLLSLIRLAVDFNMLPEEYRARVDRLFIEMQPGHIQFFAESNIESNDRDALRAKTFRDQFKDLPPLDFDNIEIKC